MPRAFPEPVIEYTRQLARVVDAKAGYFPGHSDGVAYLLRLMGSVLGLPREEADRLELAGMVHDVGKIHVPDSILMAPRKLTEDEFETISFHPVWSEQIVAAIDAPHMRTVARIVRSHHERWDGMGYPDGLKGRDIPPHARLIFVADAFHVMTSRRPYSQPMARDEALDELRANAGTQFDPDAVDVLAERGVRTALAATPYHEEGSWPVDEEHEKS